MAPKKLTGNEPRVTSAELQRWATACFCAAGCTDEDANLLSELLVDTDLRGSRFDQEGHTCGGEHGAGSHGTVLMGRPQEYIKHMLSGDVNPRPNVTVITETPTTRAFDGDGGLGHVAMSAACNWAVSAALQFGTAVATTRNHFHVGSAGKWTRRATEAGLIGICVSSHRYPLPPGAASHQDGPAGALRTVNQNSPISIGIPAGDRPPVVLDMAAGLLPWDEGLFQQAPNAFFKELGLGAIARVLGGILPGVYLPEVMWPASKRLSNQGGFFMALDPAAFLPREEFVAQMERFVDEAGTMEPFPGQAHADLPGGYEARMTAEYLRAGIPISEAHHGSLQMVSDQVNLPLPTPLERLPSERLAYAGAAAGLAFYTAGARGGFQGQEEAFHSDGAQVQSRASKL